MLRYTPGKKDWFAAGMPREGEQAKQSRAGDLARADVPTCRLTDRAGEAVDRLQSASSDMCVVVNEERVVLGLLRKERLASGGETKVEQLIEPGPTTIRPSWSIEETVEYMNQQEIEDVLVTTGDGVLIGAIYRKDVESRRRS